MKKTKKIKYFSNASERRSKKRFKWFYRVTVVCFLICVAALFMVTVEGTEIKENERISVYFGGERIAKESRLIESTTYVPLRAISEELSAKEIAWDEKTRTATVYVNSIKISVPDGASYIEAAGRILYCPTRVRNIDGRLFVPIRALAKPFSLDVEWNGEARCVLLSESRKPFTAGDGFYNATDLYWLSRIISAESAGEPFLGKIAVGNVVINRKNSRSYPNTIYGVIFDRKNGTQFSLVSYGTIYNKPTEESVIAAKICLEGYSISEEILFFMNPRYATNSWISQNRPFAFKIGGHYFYK